MERLALALCCIIPLCCGIDGDVPELPDKIELSECTTELADCANNDTVTMELGVFASAYKVTVFIVATGWCPYCRMEISAAPDLFKQFGNDVGVVVLYMETREGSRDVAARQDDMCRVAPTFDARMIYTMPADNCIYDTLQLDAYPVTVIMNQAGEILFSETGYTEGKLRRLVKYYLEEINGN